MRSERLLQIAFEASRFLELELPSQTSDHILAMDPDATEDGAFVYVQTDDPCVCAYLPTEVQAAGCRVQVICAPATKLEVH